MSLTEIPDLELDIVVLHGLHVEPNSWYRGDDLPHLQPIEDGRLAGIVEAEDEDAGLAVPEHRREEPREHDAHGGAARPTRQRGTSWGFGGDVGVWGDLGGEGRGEIWSE